MSKTTFYIVRHGESTANAHPEDGVELEGHVQGSDLTEKGIEQAKKLAKTLTPITFDKAFASEKRRALKTAEILIEGRGLTLEINPLLNERSRGEIVGQTETNIARFSGNIFNDMAKMTKEESLELKREYNIELREEALERVKQFLLETSQKYPDKTILTVTHGEIIRCLLLHLGFSSPLKLVSGTISNTAYFVLTVDGQNMNLIETHGIKESLNDE